MCSDSSERPPLPSPAIPLSCGQFERHKRKYFCVMSHSSSIILRNSGGTCMWPRRGTFISLCWSASKNDPDVTLRKNWEAELPVLENTNSREHTNLPMWLLVIIFNAGLMSDPRRNLYLAHSPVPSQPSRLAFEEGDREWNRIIVPSVCRESPWRHKMGGKKLGYSWIARWRISGLTNPLLSFLFLCKCLIPAPSFLQLFCSFTQGNLIYVKLWADNQKQWDTVGTDIHNDCSDGPFWI